MGSLHLPCPTAPIGRYTVRFSGIGGAFSTIHPIFPIIPAYKVYIRTAYLKQELPYRQTWEFLLAYRHILGYLGAPGATRTRDPLLRKLRFWSSILSIVSFLAIYLGFFVFQAVLQTIFAHYHHLLR